MTMPNGIFISKPANSNGTVVKFPQKNKNSFILEMANILKTELEADGAMVIFKKNEIFTVGILGLNGNDVEEIKHVLEEVGDDCE